MTTPEPAPEATPTPEVIDADATESMDEAPPERTTQRLEQLPVRADTRPSHVGARVIAGTDLGVVPAPNELAQLAQMAVTIAASLTAPKALQGNPNDAFMVLLTARDVGVALTTAIREFHVIDGKVTLSPKVKLAMVKQQGIGRVYPHQAPRQIITDAGEVVIWLCPCGHDGPANGDDAATWHAERNDEPGILHSSTFTMAMAARVKARENRKDITLAEKSTWRQYPQRMLSWRALGYLLDDVFPEVGTGLYNPDEMGAVTDEDGVPLIDVVGGADPVRGTRAPRGHNQPPPPEASDEQRAALRARIDALAAHNPEARAALLTLWTAEREDGSPALPALNKLLASQVTRAEAMVASIEQRVDRGEWAPVEPAAVDADGAEGADGSDGHGDAPDDETDAPGDQPEAPRSIEAQAIAEVQAMDDRPALVAALRERDLAVSGNTDTLRHRLAKAMIAERQAQAGEA